MMVVVRKVLRREPLQVLASVSCRYGGGVTFSQIHGTGFGALLFSGIKEVP